MPADVVITLIMPPTLIDDAACHDYADFALRYYAAPRRCRCYASDTPMLMSPFPLIFSLYCRQRCHMLMMRADRRREYDRGMRQAEQNIETISVRLRMPILLAHYA